MGVAVGRPVTSARQERPTKRRAHPAWTFLVALLLLSSLALLSFFRKQPGTYLDLADTLRRREIGPWSGDESCHHVHHYKPEDQCAFVKASCPDEEAGLFSYLNLYYCRLPHAKPVAFLIIVTWAALLFTTIGVAASDFFCINLSTISTFLGLSESMAGVTFLAFGNGSPDVFSTFAAIKSHSGSLAVGELIGAAGFITAVVAGSMALIRPFHVYKQSFVRDVGFFIVAVAFSMFFLANGALALWECAVMVAFYIFYVLVVVFWHWYLNRKRRKREREAIIRGDCLVTEPEELEVEGEYHDDLDRSSRQSSGRPISIIDFDALERASLLESEDSDDLNEEATRDKWMGELTSNMRITRPPDGERATNFTPIRPSLVGALEFRAVLASLHKSRNIRSAPINMRRYSDAPYFTSAQQQQTQSNTSHPEGARDAYETSIEDVVHPDRLSVEPRMSIGGRGRAVSANDAASLRIDESQLRRDSSMTDLLSFSPIIPDPPLDSSGTPDTPTPVLRRQAPAPPLVSITSPPEDTETVATGLRADRANLLNPPVENQHSRTRSGDPATPDPPGSKMLIPRSNQSSPKLSPQNSPLISALSNKASSYVPSIQLCDESPLSSPPNGLELQGDSPQWWPRHALPPPSRIARTLLPTLYGWRDKSIWEKLLGIVTAPSFFFLTITLPVVEPDKDDESPAPAKHVLESSATQDFAPSAVASAPRPPMHPHHNSSAQWASTLEQSHRHNSAEPLETQAPQTEHVSATTSTGKEWNRWLVLVQCFTAPLFIVVIFWANLSMDPRELLLPVLYSLLASLVVLLALLWTTTPAHPPRWHFLLCFAGFAVSITWISTIANEVVGVLKTIGVIFNMSDAILGLTIFAVGNSLGDLVADVTVARLGYPVMALSACFGGPMLNILLGIGLSGLYMTIDKAESRHHKHPDRPVKFKPYHVQVSTTLLISAVALMVTLIGLLIIVPLNGWKMDRRIGWGLIVLWVITTIGNVVVEVTGIGEDFIESMIGPPRW